jgi:D-alanine--D-alanine ligase
MRIGVVHTIGSPCCCAESVTVGLKELNHEFLLVDSEEIEIHASSLAKDCDLVIDHTDTYCGRGLYRAMVRLLLENCGARVVGSPAQACFVSDNKAAAKKLLADAGIPIPPGIVIHSGTWALPNWLKPPLVLKPAFEHMSRGVCVARTEEEAYAEASRLLDALKQPILVEAYIAGRELAVSLLDGPMGLQVLPVLEWGSGAVETGILTEDFKLMDPQEEKHSVIRAVLEDNLQQELEQLARHAFHVLDLRDYARFDLRMTQGGNLYFLEANTTPSLEPLEALAVSAAWAGLDYAALVERLISSAGSRYQISNPRDDRVVRLGLATGSIELELPEGIHIPPQSTVELAGLMDIQEGDRALDLGCGSGLLSIAMAKLGAQRIVATDLNSDALQAASRNARHNGVDDRIEIRAGSWYEALGSSASGSAQTGAFDVIVATPPQTPGLRPFGPKYGGRDGTRHLLKIIDAAPDFLNPEHGRLWLLAISLANPRELWKHLQERFGETRLVHQTERPFTAEEYERLEPGLFDYLLSLRSSGISDFIEVEKGRYSFQNLFIRAAKPRRI